MATAAPRALLVVEDDPELRDAVQALLRRRGFEVACARDGRDALRQLRTSPVKPAAILLDLRMPIMDGVAFREEQVQDPELATIPVVLVSSEHSLLETAAGLMPVAVIEKPVAADAIVAIVEEILRSS
jgi:DNA-binding response OmpR family regulator